jgi:hypothetical protein
MRERQALLVRRARSRAIESGGDQGIAAGGLKEDLEEFICYCFLLRSFALSFLAYILPKPPKYILLPFEI